MAGWREGEEEGLPRCWSFIERGESNEEARHGLLGDDEWHLEPTSGWSLEDHLES